MNGHGNAGRATTGADVNATRDGRAADRLPDLRFSTENQPPRLQFEAWQAGLSAWMDLQPLQDPSQGFRAEQRIWQLGPLAVTWSAGDGVINRRDAARARRDQLDHWVLTLVRRGEFRCDIDGNLVRVNERILAPYGMHMPSRSERSDAEWLMVFIARDALPESAAAFDSLLNRPLETVLGTLLREYLDELGRQLPRMTTAEAPRAAEATLAMLRAAITGSADHRMAAQPLLHATVRSRVMGLIRGQLGSARLDPARLCRMAGVSRSQLYRIFEPEGGVARTIQRERLRAARRALADPAERRSIAAIGEAMGMPDPSVFSRAFRQEHGMTPRAFREAALAGDGSLPLPAGSSGRAPHLGEVFRQLRA